MQIEKVPLELLVFDPSNARKHSTKNIESIKSSLARFGQQKPIVVDKDNVVLAGNGTLEAAKSLGWTELEAIKTTLSGPMAIAYAIADNRTSELAEWDNETLAAHLQGLREDDWDLSDLGFDVSDLDNLSFEDHPKEYGDPDKEWVGMPEFDHEDKTSAFQIIVHLKNKEDQESFSGLIGQKLTDKTRSIWYPAAEIESYADKRYVETQS